MLEKIIWRTITLNYNYSGIFSVVLVFSDNLFTNENLITFFCMGGCMICLVNMIKFSKEMVPTKYINEICRHTFVH